MRGDLYAQDNLLNQVNQIEQKGVGADIQLGAWDPDRGTWDDVEITQPGAAPIQVSTFSGYGDAYPGDPVDTTPDPGTPADPGDGTDTPVAQTYRIGDGMGGQPPNPDVSNIQNELATLGYQVGVDGMYGQQTAAAVSDFQHSNNLPVTGEADPDTQQLLAQQAASQQGN
jgi:hypothetical protein